MQNLEKPKLKHNKKRNTAFLYETLVKELTKSVVYGDKEKQKSISLLIKEHFKKNGLLDRELTLYKQIYETKQFPKDHCEKLLKEVEEQHNKLDEQDIFNEQSKLIAKINKTLGFEVYNNFVPNYKTLATISQIFNRSIEPRKKVLLEQELIGSLSSPEEKKQEIKIVEKGVLKRFIEKFNETYSKSLLPEQKQLLSKYINNTEDNVELKIYLNEEIERLKKELSVLKNTNIIIDSNELKEKVYNIDELLKQTKFETVNEELIKKVMFIQEFIKEVNS